MNAKRLISASIAVLALGTFSGVQPAQANPAGGGNYAASVATTTTPFVDKKKKRAYRFGAIVRSTSSSVDGMHGTLAITVTRNGATYFSNSKSIATLTGTPVSLGAVSRKRFPGKKLYLVTATFTAASGHIEKSSSSSIVVKL